MIRLNTPPTHIQFLREHPKTKNFSVDRLPLSEAEKLLGFEYFDGFQMPEMFFKTQINAKKRLPELKTVTNKSMDPNLFALYKDPSGYGVYYIGEETIPKDKIISLYGGVLEEYTTNEDSSYAVQSWYNELGRYRINAKKLGCLARFYNAAPFDPEYLLLMKSFIKKLFLDY